MWVSMSLRHDIAVSGISVKGYMIYVPYSYIVGYFKLMSVVSTKSFLLSIISHLYLIPDQTARQHSVTI